MSSVAVDKPVSVHVRPSNFGCMYMYMYVQVTLDACNDV